MTRDILTRTARITAALMASTMLFAPPATASPAPDPSEAVGERPMPTTLRDKAEYALDVAAEDLDRADEVDAEMRAPLLYTKATLAHDAAAEMYAAGRYAEAVSRAVQATRLARNAYEEALPDHRDDALEARLEARRDLLLTRLLEVATPIVSDEDISVSLIDYFSRDGDTVRSSKQGTLDTLARIAAAFPEYEVRIVGHTDSEGHPTHNLMLSQTRALAVRKALEARGVDRDRLTSVGEGASDAVEIDRGEVANARIDVIFEPLSVELVDESAESAEGRW